MAAPGTRRTALAAAAMSLLVTACTSGAGGGGGPAATRRPARFGLADTPGAHASGIRFTPRTVDVPRAVVAATLQRVSPDGADYTFATRSGPLAALATGKVMLLEGTALRRVLWVRRTGSRLLAHTAPAALTDAVSAGALSWRTPVDFAAGFRDPAAGPARGTVDGYAYSAAYRPRGTALDVAAELRRTAPVGLLIIVTGTLDQLTTRGAIAVRGGHLDAVTLAAALAGRFTVRYTAKAVAALGTGGEQTVRVPVGYRVPVVVGGLPFSLDVRSSFAVAVGFGQRGLAVSGTSTLDLAGAAGLTVTGRGGTSPATGLRAAGRVRPAAGGLSRTGPIGAVLGAAAPGLGFSLGVYGVEPAAYLEVTATTSVQVTGPDDPGSGRTTACDARSLAVTGTAGVTAAAFGLPTTPDAVTFLRARRARVATPLRHGRRRLSRSGSSAPRPGIAVSLPWLSAPDAPAGDRARRGS